MSAATAPQERLWTCEEYYKMAEAGVFHPDERVELIGGRIIPKHCAPSGDKPYPERLWTCEEYYKMAGAGIFRPGERVELIGGRIVSMSPQNGPHFTAISLAEEALRNIFGVGHAIRVQGPLDLRPLSQPEPDIAVVRGTVRDYATAHPTTAVLVVEVSDSTLAYDRGEKASLYASAGIPEYWIINLMDRHLEVSRDPMPMPNQSYGYGYRTISHYLATDMITPLAGGRGSILVADLLP